MKSEGSLSMKILIFTGLTLTCIATITCSNTNTLGSQAASETTGKLVALSPASIAAGTSPFNIAVDPKGKYAYVPNYSDNTISQYAINNGVLSALSPSTVLSKDLNPKCHRD